MKKTDFKTIIGNVKKYLSILFLLCFVGALVYAYLYKPEFPSKIVLKQGFIPGQFIYVVQDARDRGEPISLRLYVNDSGVKNNESMNMILGRTPPFLVTDTDLKDLEIQHVSNGLHIRLKGAVSIYSSNLHLKNGDTFTNYYVSLEQVDTRPPLPSGR
ncbi:MULTISPECIES: hypothetical protein [Pseudomonas]|uniref:Uncharacterized protein n=1 Tax=Pseudomonas quercus TaxID=2722792 RepID=A0ABX0YDB7_9PSED|nr:MULTISPECIES: hypothetical protein [Pseudomonas]MBF7142734.1 hypothetical protein [Pseudomonas sp. LY10J]NJP01272.1 hypothetical protein [Pseudomonas quercus]